MSQTTRVNRQDLTLRNLRAMKKRIAALEARVATLEAAHPRRRQPRSSARAKGGR